MNLDIWQGKIINLLKKGENMKDKKMEEKIYKWMEKRVKEMLIEDFYRHNFQSWVEVVEWLCDQTVHAYLLGLMDRGKCN